MNRISSLVNRTIGRRSASDQCDEEDVALSTESGLQALQDNGSPIKDEERIPILSTTMTTALVHDTTYGEEPPTMGSSERTTHTSNQSSLKEPPLIQRNMSNGVQYQATTTAKNHDQDEDYTDIPDLKKICCYYYRQNMCTVSSVILLSVLFAVAGNRASLQGQDKANYFVENDHTTMDIKWRPCQIYSAPNVLGVNQNSGTKVLQTSLGDPSNHWGEIPCLTKTRSYMNMNLDIHNKKHEQNKQEESDDQSWSWITNSLSALNANNEPFEYGMPSAEIYVKPDIVAHPDRQPILGFGGAVTEASALNYKSLSKDGQNAIMELLFSKDGLGYTLGRVHMNSCDFSTNSYSFDDVEDDFDLLNFDTDVKHDQDVGMVEMMVRADQIVKKDWPLKSSLSSNDELSNGMRMIVSPWSPPAWMKLPTDQDPPGAIHAGKMTGSALPTCLREGTDGASKYAAAWALYFTKFLTSYKSLGVNVFAVTVQNEPEFAAPWEACAYNPWIESSFIANHLGPALRKAHPNVKLLMFDHNKDHVPHWGQIILNSTDDGASSFVDGTAVHWYAGGMDRLLDGAVGQPNMHRFVSMINDLKHVNTSNHLLLGSEACHCPTTGYAGGDLKVAWDRAERYAHTVLADLAAGSNGWIEWNLVLDALGGPNHLGNLCDSPLLAVPYRAGGRIHNKTLLPPFEHANFPFGPVIGDGRTVPELDAMGFPADFLNRGVVVQPMYYYMGHISRHVRPGSRAVHAIVGQSIQNAGARTFRRVLSNGDIVAGGGLNNLARSGVELTLWPCEGSTRQEWSFDEESGEFKVYGHDWLGVPTVSCIAREPDKAFRGLLLTDCNTNHAAKFDMKKFDTSINGDAQSVDSSPMLTLQVKNTMEQHETDRCLVVQPLLNEGGSYGPRGGAQVTIGRCTESKARWKFDSKAGELTSNYFDSSGGEVCLTTGWPFLQVGAFDTPNAEMNKAVIILNEGGEAANYVLRNDGEVFMTNSIPAHSIQTVLYN